MTTLAWQPVGRMEQPAWGAGIATVSGDGQVLDAWFPGGRFGLGPPVGTEPELDDEPPLPLAGLRTVPTRVVIGSLADPPTDAADVYLRLHLLSSRLVRPHEPNLDGIFGHLANVAWTSAGPCPPERVDEL